MEIVVESDYVILKKNVFSGRKKKVNISLLASSYKWINDDMLMLRSKAG